MTTACCAPGSASPPKTRAPPRRPADRDAKERTSRAAALAGLRPSRTRAAAGKGGHSEPAAARTRCMSFATQRPFEECWRRGPQRSPPCPAARDVRFPRRRLAPFERRGALLHERADALTHVLAVGRE